MTASVRSAVERIGRTEDLRFSPDNRLLALADFGSRSCLILRVHVDGGGSEPRITADDFLELDSDGIGLVHGLEFLDNQTLAFASRDAGVSLVQIPDGEPGGRSVSVEPLRWVRGGRIPRVKSPGSVALARDGAGGASLLVCNNYRHTVTSHDLDPGSWNVQRERTLLWRGLKIPDGIAVSPDQEWIAVSSHGTHDVKIYARSADPGWRSQPAGALHGVDYPHGLRFTPDGRHVIVADAGRPCVCVYERGETWRGDRGPVAEVAVVGDEAFARGRIGPNGRIKHEEGGPKGIDVDATGRIVAVTCEEQPLAFYSLADVLGTAAAGVGTELPAAAG